MDTEETGVLAKILAPDNTKDVTVGSLIALLVEEGDDWTKVEIPADAGAKPQPSSAASAPASHASTAAKPQTTTSAEHSHLMGPSVKKLLHEYNISSSSVPASGRSGVLLKGDVLDYIQAKNLAKVDQKAGSPATSSQPSKPAQTPAAAPSSAGSNYVDIPLSNMRRTIARRLTESKVTIPHAYASIDSNVGPVSDLRKTLLADGIKVSVNDFIIKASALALQRVPRVNAVWANDGPQLSPTVDISVAVATPNGLITPIVKGATYLTVEQIGNIVKELAGKAKENKLQPHEFQGGSFSISNLGMFGITEFTAVINLPQVAILAVGTSRPVATMTGNQHRMTVTMSYDSRAISEIEATQWLQEFRSVIENPKSMLSGTNLDSTVEAFAF
uniref:Peripheral subunit-binding (PSBD) domain-containing protein n=2 Tax=Arion vulgaris TaxID=1028688 RepID=A0A0B6YQN0_9EUPU